VEFDERILMSVGRERIKMCMASWSIAKFAMDN
jgi:hypothetical protein